MGSCDKWFREWQKWESVRHAGAQRPGEIYANLTCWYWRSEDSQKVWFVWIMSRQQGNTLRIGIPLGTCVILHMSPYHTKPMRLREVDWGGLTKFARLEVPNQCWFDVVMEQNCMFFNHIDGNVPSHKRYLKSSDIQRTVGMAINEDIRWSVVKRMVYKQKKFSSSICVPQGGQNEHQHKVTFNNYYRLNTAIQRHKDLSLQTLLLIIEKSSRDYRKMSNLIIFFRSYSVQFVRKVQNFFRWTFWGLFYIHYNFKV